MLENGRELSPETRLWDERIEKTVAMRRKETSADYRYFPEPDLVGIHLDETWIRRVRETIPELPVARRLRFQKERGLTEYDAGVLTDDRSLADYFEECLRPGEASAKSVANWVINDMLRLLKEKQLSLSEFTCPPRRIAVLAAMVEKGELNVSTAREVFAEMIEKDRDPSEIVEAKGLKQISDSSAIEGIVAQVLADNPKVVADWKAGKKAAFNALIGPVMRASKGKANPRIVRELLQKQLDAL